MIEKMVNTILPEISGFYEVKLNGHRLQYWEHRSNYVFYDLKGDRRLHIFTPTEYAKKMRVSKGVGYDWKHFVKELKETTLDDNIPRILFSYTFSVFMDDIESIRVTEYEIFIHLKGNLVLELFKNSTSREWDKGNIPKSIDFNLCR